MSKCCKNCFNDLYLKNLLDSTGEKGDCDYCYSQGVGIVSTEKLGRFFQPLIDSYIPDSLVDTQSALSSNTLIEVLNKEWNIFGKGIKRTKQCEELLKAILKDTLLSYKIEELVSNYVIEKVSTENQRLDQSRWIAFCKEIRNENRFNPSTSLNIPEFKKLLYHCEITYTINYILYRARNHKNDKTPIPLKELGKPPKEKSKNGRANPVGISYLYAASNIETAIAEIKPSFRDYITIGRFEIIKRSIIIDLRNISPLQFHRRENQDNLLTITRFLQAIRDELSKPINFYDSELEYLPIQYICEIIRQYGADGIVFKSTVADGDNYVIFNENKVKCTKRYTRRIDKISYDAEKT